jgi:Fe-S oxidoreductase
MLTILEKILFILAVLASILTAIKIISRITYIIRRGHGKPDWKQASNRLALTLLRTVTFQPVFRFRFWPSFFHALIGWGFIYYLLVNLIDVLNGLFSNFPFPDDGLLSNFYRLGADVLSVLALTGMVALMIRRFLIKPESLSTRNDVLLQPSAKSGILRDSAIVSLFILVHVGSRFLGDSFYIAVHGARDWQPLALAVSLLWTGLSETALEVAIHITFWLAIGTILAFIPYFLYSKHIHIFMAPLNLLLKPKRRSIGELGTINFDDETIEQFGAIRIEDLGWEQILDAYACIMCYRCQEVCPAYTTGKVLSPATLEINKRYLLNLEGKQIAKGEQSSKPLIEFAISPEAVWACTACGACVDICPVGNEPMRDILDIRRALVLMDNAFPDQLQTAYRGMERNVNPWNISPIERLRWAEGINVPTIEQNPQPEILWWVGCAPATDPRAQKTARAFAQLLAKAGVNYAVLGKLEQCTGDSARRTGNEYLFSELAKANVEILNEIAPKRIVTTCPHCLHTLKNEYPALNGNFDVIHHSQLINELLEQGSLNIMRTAKKSLNNDTDPNSALNEELTITYHDPCYLGRHNLIYSEPRNNLQSLGYNFIEMSRNSAKSFCCGAGGGQMWKEEENGNERVNTQRFNEAQKSGARILAVSCPFCMIMLNDARRDANSDMQILDIAEVIVNSLEP